MITPIDLGGVNKNYNSRLSRTNIVNGYIEHSADGKFKRIRRSNGLKLFQTVGTGPIRGMFRLKNLVYVVSGSELYEMDDTNSTLLGDVGGIDQPVRMNANGTDFNQIIIISDQLGYLYDSVSGFRQIVNVNFFADCAVASLNQIFWTNNPDTNQFGGSEAANGEVWPNTRIASAEQSPDILVYIVAKKTALWLMGSRTIEFWQTNAGDTVLGVRPVAGATIERGVGAQKSVAEWQDSIFWLADDGTVWMIEGTQARKISDLNIEYAIRGDGRLAGYTSPETAQGFFIDHPVHKQYVLTFPSDNITWIYDVKTQSWSLRESKDIGRWRGNNSVLAFDNVLIGDYRNGKIYEWSEDVFTEDGETMSFELVTPAIRSTDTDLFISFIEMVMEVGVGAVGDPAPKMQIKYSRDGGATYKSKADIEFGAIGERQTKVIRRQFGRTKRLFEFVLKFTITDAVPVDIYELFADIEKGS